MRQVGVGRAADISDKVFQSYHRCLIISEVVKIVQYV